jgi:quinol---cytochrome-c reductase cytochrome b subunit
VIRRAVRVLDARAGASPFLRKTLRYVFPDHWSFLLGEIALYSFLILVATGTYLALFFDPSHVQVVYHGSYQPLDGLPVSRQFQSAVDISFKVTAGLLMRQTHHWAALVFLVAITLHLLRIFFTGAFRRPRDLNYMIGLTMLMLALLEGYAGYSLPDDLLSGMGLVIGYSVALAIPFVGASVATLIWGGRFPGAEEFWSRLYIVHVLVLPVLIGTLIAVHLVLIARPRHTDFPGAGRTERRVRGTPLWPAYALRSGGLFLATAAVLVLLGGLVQINPIWQWGPFHTYLATNGAQPDWYLGWLIGALRLMPPIEPTIAGYTLFPNPFFGGVLFPMLVFGLLYAWPWLERKVTRDVDEHHLLDRPRDRPRRTALGAAFFSFVAVIFLAGSADRIFLAFGIPYEGQVWFFRAAVLWVPVVAYWLTRRVCEELRDLDAHPLRGWQGRAVRRTDAGGFAPVAPSGASDDGPAGGQPDADRPAPPAGAD